MGVARPDDTYDHRHLSHLYGVWPLDEINPYDTPDLAAAAHRALELRGAENDSAHGHLHHALVAARLRDGERVTRALGQVLDGDFFHDSLMSAHYPGRNVYNADAAHTLPAVLIEVLVQSTPDRLVLLPALPMTCPKGRLRGVRTRFGAEVDLDWGPGHGRRSYAPPEPTGSTSEPPPAHTRSTSSPERTTPSTWERGNRTEERRRWAPCPRRARCGATVAIVVGGRGAC